MGLSGGILAGDLAPDEAVIYLVLLCCSVPAIFRVRIVWADPQLIAQPLLFGAAVKPALAAQEQFPIDRGRRGTEGVV
jgi:hypothetical protein